MDYLDFGASLYVPATRMDLVQIGNGISMPKLRSVIFCTEDAIKQNEIPLALENISQALKVFAKDTIVNAPYRFARPRNPEILRQMLNMEGVETLRGFALPKFTLSNMDAWFNILKDYPNFVCMPILESEEVFDANAMRLLRDAFVASPLRDQIAVLRVGGLDLLNLMDIRRQCSRTIYETVLCQTLQQLSTIFVPAGFMLSSPVFECMDYYDTFREEIELDKLNGYYLKSIIHPSQIPVLEEAYKVASSDLDMANAIFDPKMPAVFRIHDRMCEKSTHGNWAKRILRLAQIYGVKTI